VTSPALTHARLSITAAAAQKMVEAAERHATSLGMAIVTVIVDESGVLKLLSRMDGAPLVAVGAAQKKALTAVGFGLPTGKAWHDFIKDDPILLQGAPSLPDFTLLGGGFPLKSGGALVGAIGVSGGHYAHDEACARAALAAVGLEG
jgi:uncharacterized protein GlcG (DUF336 family)